MYLFKKLEEFQKMNYDITYFDDGFDFILGLPILVKSFLGDLEEVHVGSKYTFFFTKDFFDKVDNGFSLYPRVSYGVTYFDITIESFILDINDRSISNKDTGYAKLWGPKLGVSLDMFADTNPYILRGAISAEYTPYGEFEMTTNHFASSLDKNRVYFHLNVYAGFRF